MKSIIEIDAQSFFRSNYERLSWSIKEETDNGTNVSLQEDSVTDKEDIREALQNHIYNISNAIAHNGDLIDFEITLSFAEDMDEAQKEEFTTLVNEFNTRDEST